MKRYLLIRKIALSTLLLSAIASPSAFADATPELPTNPIKAVPFLTISAASVMDPLKLAETYAPETVDDWKQTLAEYEEAIASRVKVTAGNIATLVKTVQVDQVAPIQIQPGAEPVVFGTVTTFSGGESISVNAVEKAESAVLTEADIAAPVKLEAVPGAVLTAVGTNENVSFTIAVSPNAEGQPINDFMQGWSDLSKAVESKDGNAIKQALAHQLTLYKQKIVLIKNDDQTIAQASVQAIPATPAEQSND
ncbi:hypothetical protein FE784_19580 [Paenibacillus hemerocallicola]|uniref:DUF1002 domain-containing protein n=1 Tax=Paenibacillus hemerocallicola TaxID=1172614 RepID=A0A5C4T8C9_9BACL|nr:hypothetical protein [Paenibacillus hemerocallicola]TNJ64647.1 hypothetical protein FE784_19580 [Paenibacillus hemerocallicola]